MCRRFTLQTHQNAQLDQQMEHDAVPALVFIIIFSALASWLRRLTSSIASRKNETKWQDLIICANGVNRPLAMAEENPSHYGYTL
jgi:hypothetical protein